MKKKLKNNILCLNRPRSLFLFYVLFEKRDNSGFYHRFKIFKSRKFKGLTALHFTCLFLSDYLGDVHIDGVITKPQLILSGNVCVCV